MSSSEFGVGGGDGGDGMPLGRFARRPGRDRGAASRAAALWVIELRAARGRVHMNLATTELRRPISIPHSYSAFLFLALVRHASSFDG